MDDGNTPRTLKTVRTAIRVVRGLEELNGAGVTELADHLGLSKSVVYNHLATLKAEQFVVQESGTYELSLRFLTLGEFVKHRNVLYEGGRDETDDLAEETGEYAHLMAEEYGLGVYLHKARGENAVGEPYHTMNLEKPDYLHYTSTGKAVLAHLPAERVDEIVDEHGLPRRTENTITDRDELHDELATVRERGFALNDEEEITGLRAVGAPIRDSDGGVLGAISVSGPTTRMQGQSFQEGIPERVTRAANIIELNIETSALQ